MSSLPEISEMVNAIEVFDTHEHLAGFDWGFTTESQPFGPTHPHKSLPHVLMNDMLLYITSAALYRGPSIAPQSWKIEDAFAYWKTIQPALEELRGAAVYAVIRRGIKELYGFDVDEVTDKNLGEYNNRIVATYNAKGQPAWMLEVLKRAKVKAIIQMAHLPYLIEYWPSLPPERRKCEQAVVRPSLVLEPFFFSGFEPDRSKARARTMELLGMHPRNHAEHLEFQHAAVARHRKEGGAALKIICAYQRTLRFERVPDSEAKRLYDKGWRNLSAPELQRLQDNLVWHLMRAAQEFSFPVQVHTGYSYPTLKGDPENLFPLTRQFPEVQFYFAHAGWPNYGGLAILARTYTNIHFGFCWMPGLSPALAARLMDEMFDMLPANKMLIGMDCGHAESFYGTAVLTRELIAKVLAAKVDSGLISMRAARTIAQRILHDNAVNLFGRTEERAAVGLQAGAGA
jgi:hypothetical protein